MNGELNFTWTYEDYLAVTERENSDDSEERWSKVVDLIDNKHYESVDDEIRNTIQYVDESLKILLKEDSLTKGEMFIHEWQYGYIGKTSFKGYLAKALAVADTRNLAKLKLAFPEEAEAMDNFHHKKGWWEIVQDKFDASHLLIINSTSPQTRVATTKRSK